MELYLDKNKIMSYEDWKYYYQKKDKIHWSVGRSAERLAKSWFAGIPEDIKTLLNDNGFNTDRMNKGYIEYKTSLDQAKGDRVHDLCFPVVNDSNGDFTLSIEAKVDEPFDVLNEVYYKRALTYLKENPRSQALKRIKTIYEILTGNDFNTFNYTKHQFMNIGYQLFSGLLGSIAETNKHGNKKVLFLIQTFITDKISEKKHEMNEKNYRLFLNFLGIKKRQIKNKIFHLNVEWFTNNIYVDKNFKVKYIPKDIEVYIGNILSYDKGN